MISALGRESGRDVALDRGGGPTEESRRGSAETTVTRPESPPIVSRAGIEGWTATDEATSNQPPEYSGEGSSYRSLRTRPTARYAPSIQHTASDFP